MSAALDSINTTTQANGPIRLIYADGAHPVSLGSTTSASTEPNRVRLLARSRYTTRMGRWIIPRCVPIALLLVAGCGGSVERAGSGNGETGGTSGDGGTEAPGGAGSGGENPNTPERILPLDPTQRHYGASYAEWAGEWAAWLMTFMDDPDCEHPYAEDTGSCQHGQDPDSDVFFLASRLTSPITRTDCRIPAGKALFLALVALTSDHGLVPEEEVPADPEEADAQLHAAAHEDYEEIASRIGELTLVVNGDSYEDFEQFVIDAAPYQYTHPEPWNASDCLDGPHYSGTYSGYVSGCFVMLPPLPTGEHVLEFGPVGWPGHTIGVRYDPLTVE
jgi:hypothetical protein